MRCGTTFLIVVPLLLATSVVLPFVEAEVTPVYTDEFVVQVDGGPEVAKELAKKHGFTYHTQLLGDYHVLTHNRLQKRSLERSEEHHEALSKEPQVRWFSQQELKKRVKRDYREMEPLRGSGAIRTKLNDPRWPQMWYLNRGEGLDMNVQEAWAQGVTGKGIVVTILDDGLEKDHPDIMRNYDKDASYDVNNHDGDPQPRYDIIDSNRHGTRCAGEVAANANNSICAVGVAYEALVGGVRMLDGDVTDAVEAQSLSLNPEHIDIYSASWGPDDDGKTVDGPGPLASTAFKEGILKGRSGKGSIFVWASGNGGREHDNCNCDGYTNSMWTLSISSATENGQVPWYSEACSSTLAATYSSGANGERQIVTTDLHHGCTSTHTGTSASAPLAAGICALALEANKNLTWRDMQHIVVRTARRANLHAKDWKINGVGRSVSHSFGYGLMDAGAMVRLARKWTTAPVQKLCEIRSEHADKLIPAKSHVELSLMVRCVHVRFLEHVQAKITLSATRRGDIHIYLTSPNGTRSTLLAQRPIDGSRSGFNSWPFMTVHNWGENPDGVWKLEVHNEGRFYGRASLKEWYLHLYGTTEDPDRPRTTTTTTTLPPPTTTTSSTTTTTTPPPPPPSTTAGTTYNQHRQDSPQYGEPSASTSKPRSATYRPTAQYYPLTTAGVQVYPAVNEDPLTANGLFSQQPVSGTRMEMHESANACPRGQFHYQGTCVLQCPSGHYGSAIGHHRSAATATAIDHHHQQLMTSASSCLPCHYSCLDCHGPGDYQCLACHPDSSLDHGYCEPDQMSDNGEQFLLRMPVAWNDVVVGVFTALGLVTVGLTIYVVVSLWPPPCCRQKYVCVDSSRASTFSSKSSSEKSTCSANVVVTPYYDSDDEL